MSIWIIEPHEPLIFRDGRPFSTNPGASANSLPFPFPSTTTGGVRTQAGLDEHGVLTSSSEDVLNLHVRGPLLVQLSTDDSKLEWLAPAPADALLLKPEKEQHEHDEGPGEQNKVKAELRRLIPLNVGDALTDLDGLSKQAEFDPPLSLVGTVQPTKQKPMDSSQVPGFWHWSCFEKWLLDPSAKKTIQSWDEVGIHGLPGEQRVHITFDKDLHAARDEALFETNGREFTARGEDQHNLNSARQLALAVIVGEDAKDNRGEKLTPHPGFATLGGERRLVHWRRSSAELLKCPDALIEQVADEGACRIILLTPTYFTRGCYPGQKAFQQLPQDVRPQLRALVVDRPQVVSGWDLAHKADNGRSRGRPKPTRRLVPAGSVLFLKLDGTPDTIKRWVKAAWLQCIGDDEQYCNDGFGLAVVGTWDGTPQEMMRGSRHE